MQNIKSSADLNIEMRLKSILPHFNQQELYIK